MESVYEIFARGKIIIKFEETLLKLGKTSPVYLAYIATSEVRAEKKTCLAHGCNRPVIMHSLHRRAAL